MSYCYDNVACVQPHPWIPGVNVHDRVVKTDNACYNCHYPLDDHRGSCAECLMRKRFRYCFARFVEGQCEAHVFSYWRAGSTAYACCAGHDFSLSGLPMTIVVNIFQQRSDTEPCASVKLEVPITQCTAENIMEQALRQSTLISDHWMLDQPVCEAVARYNKQYPLQPIVTGLASFDTALANNTTLRDFFCDMISKGVYSSNDMVTKYICNFPYPKVTLGAFVQKGFSYANVMSIADFHLLGGDDRTDKAPFVLPLKSFITSSLPVDFHVNSEREFVLQMITTTEYAERLASASLPKKVQQKRKPKLVVPVPVSIKVAAEEKVGSTTPPPPPPLLETRAFDSSPLPERDLTPDFLQEEQVHLDLHLDEKFDFEGEDLSSSSSSPFAGENEEEEEQQKPKAQQQQKKKRERSKPSVEIGLSARALWFQTIGFDAYDTVHHTDLVPRYFVNANTGKHFVLYPLPGALTSFKELCKQHAQKNGLKWQDMIDGRDMNTGLMKLICPFDSGAGAKSYIIKDYENEEEMMSAYHLYLHLYLVSKEKMSVHLHRKLCLGWVLHETLRGENDADFDFSAAEYKDYNLPTRAVHWASLREDRKTMCGEEPYIMTLLHCYKKKNKSSSSGKRTKSSDN